MTAYVDTPRRERDARLLADTRNELLAFADRLGLKPEALRFAGTHYEHFAIDADTRERAIAEGASAVSAGELARILYKRS